jgi:hypothetical protein
MSHLETVVEFYKQARFPRLKYKPQGCRTVDWGWRLRRR